MAQYCIKQLSHDISEFAQIPYEDYGVMRIGTAVVITFYRKTQPQAASGMRIVL